MIFPIKREVAIYIFQSMKLYLIFTFNRYVVTDVLLLCDVIEKYRDMCRTRFDLEALAYVSLPSLTFDACLKVTKTRLQIIKDIDMLQMIESGIRGQFLFYLKLCIKFTFII